MNSPSSLKNDSIIHKDKIIEVSSAFPKATTVTARLNKYNKEIRKFAKGALNNTVLVRE